MTASSSASQVRQDPIQLFVGKTYCSKWFQVTQRQVEAFAQATGDDQWIHCSQAGPAGSPFKGPIAHGLLLMSLGINLARECGALPDETLVLYGFDNVRFRGPVRSGTRVRCLTTVHDVRKLPGRLLFSTRFLMEIEDQRVPALVADCLLLSLSQAPEVAVGLPIEYLAK